MTKIRMWVVFYQRYPEDDVSSKVFESKAEAYAFWLKKNTQYSYTVGRVWMKEATLNA